MVMGTVQYASLLNDKNFITHTHTHTHTFKLLPNLVKVGTTVLDLWYAVGQTGCTLETFRGRLSQNQQTGGLTAQITRGLYYFTKHSPVSRLYNPELLRKEVPQNQFRWT